MGLSSLLLFFLLGAGALLIFGAIFLLGRSDDSES